MYRPDVTAEVYAALAERARHLLEAGEPVILDASWSDRRRRAQAAELARATASDLVELRCDAPAPLAAARIDRRRRKGGDPSDATAEVAAAMAASPDPWPTAVTVDTAGSVALALEQALAALGPTGQISRLLR